MSAWKTPPRHENAAALLADAGRFLRAEPRVGGLILHFERWSVEVSGHYRVTTPADLKRRDP